MIEPVVSILPIATILDVGYVSSYLAVADQNKQRLYRGNNLGGDKLGLLIFIVSEIIAWHNENNPDDPTLIDTGNYLWWLCGKYQQQALAIIGEGGGGTTLVTDDGTPLRLEPFRMQFKVGGSEWPSGEVSKTLPWRSFGTSNDDIEVVLQNAVDNAIDADTVGDFAYKVTYNLTTTVITWQINGVDTAPNDDQIMIISGFKIL